MALLDAARCAGPEPSSFVWESVQKTFRPLFLTTKRSQQLINGPSGTILDLRGGGGGLAGGGGALGPEPGLPCPPPPPQSTIRLPQAVPVPPDLWTANVWRLHPHLLQGFVKGGDQICKAKVGAWAYQGGVHRGGSHVSHELRRALRPPKKKKGLQNAQNSVKTTRHLRSHLRRMWGSAPVRARRPGPHGAHTGDLRCTRGGLCRSLCLCLYPVPMPVHCPPQDQSLCPCLRLGLCLCPRLCRCQCRCPQRPCPCRHRSPIRASADQATAYR